MNKLRQKMLVNRLYGIVDELQQGADSPLARQVLALTEIVQEMLALTEEESHE